MLTIFISVSCTKEKVKLEDSSLSKKAEASISYEGKITIFGNEPFTELGLNVNDTESYILECSKELKDSLRKNQGQTYKVFVSKKTETNLGTKLSVIKVEKITK
ncbi:MAG: hypothetical protein V3V16_01320 [Melioribacteraceae bacterium]